MSVRLLVVGRTGQVARELTRATPPAGVQLMVRGRPELDLHDAESIRRTVHGLAPDVVANAAAYTAVDAAEDDPDAAFAVNADGAGHLAAAARAVGAGMIQISTDYVFDGQKAGPYTEEDPVNPLGVYGRSKAAGERAVRDATADHVILRTAWVYSPFGRNFVRTMLRVGAERDRLTVVDDQVGTPSAAHDIAAAVLSVGRAMRAGDGPPVAGTYHLAGAGSVSWCGFAREIFRQSQVLTGGPAPAVVAIPSSQWPTRAPRPANSRLACDRFAGTFGWTPPAWPKSLHHVLRDLRPPPGAAGGGAGHVGSDGEL